MPVFPAASLIAKRCHNTAESVVLSLPQSRAAHFTVVINYYTICYITCSYYGFCGTSHAIRMCTYVTTMCRAYIVSDFNDNMQHTWPGQLTSSNAKARDDAMNSILFHLQRTELKKEVDKLKRQIIGTVCPYISSNGFTDLDNFFEHFKSLKVICNDFSTSAYLCWIVDTIIGVAEARQRAATDTTPTSAFCGTCRNYSLVGNRLVCQCKCKNRLDRGSFQHDYNDGKKCRPFSTGACLCRLP